MKGFNFDYEFSHFVDMKDEELGNKTWSEEDLRQLAEHFFALGKLVGKNEKMNPTIEQVEWLRGIRDRLKSLRPSWKPSEEQMKALNAMNCCGELSYQGQQQLLIDLYQQLKKL